MCCFHCSGSVLVYMIDTTTGSMQLSHKLELTPKHYPGITHTLPSSLFPTSNPLSSSVSLSYKFPDEITYIPSAVSLMPAHACVSPGFYMFQSFRESFLRTQLPLVEELPLEAISRFSTQTINQLPG